MLGDVLVQSGFAFYSPMTLYSLMQCGFSSAADI
jgi:hypothetical protein